MKAEYYLNLFWLIELNYLYIKTVNTLVNKYRTGTKNGKTTFGPKLHEGKVFNFRQKLNNR